MMENLRKQKGKKYGSKAMRLALWRKRDIAERVKKACTFKGNKILDRMRMEYIASCL